MMAMIERVVEVMFVLVLVTTLSVCEAEELKGVSPRFICWLPP